MNRYKVFKFGNIIYFLFFLLFTLGQLEFFIINKVSNLIHIILMFAIAFSIFTQFDRIKGWWSAPLFVFLVCTSILLVFPIGNNFFADFSRVSWFLLLAMIPFYFKYYNLPLEKYFIHIFDFYLVISLIIVLDSLCYFIFGNTFLFEFDYYITPRFSGPFNDSNFLGFIFAVIYIAVSFDSISYNRRLYLKVLSAVCVLLSGSFATIIFLFISMLGSYFFIMRFQIIKLIFAVLTSFLFFSIIYDSKDYVVEFLTPIFSFILDGSDVLVEIKLRSLFYRLEAVTQAVSLINVNPFGYGYFTLLDFLDRDTHNSFIGMVFEYGLFPLFSIFACQSVITSNRIADSLLSYITLMPMMLNIHYSPMYILTILLVFFIKKYK